jgi:hypothetical protein
MPNNEVYKSYNIVSICGGILENVLQAVKSAKAKAVKNSTTEVVDVYFRGHRQDMLWGKILIVPAAVCDGDYKDIPTPITEGAVLKYFADDAEDLAKFESFRLVESEFEVPTPEDIQRLKDVIFKSNGRYSPIVVFCPAWGHTRDFTIIRWVEDEDRLKELLRHLCFGAYYNPSFGVLYKELATTDERLDLVHLGDNGGLKQFTQAEEDHQVDAGINGVAWVAKPKSASKRRPTMLITAADMKIVAEELKTPGEAITPEEDAVFEQVGENAVKASSLKKADHDEYDEEADCPSCGGPGVPLGGLGNRKHYRCRDCGADFSHEAKPKQAAFMYTPGQVLKEFYPEIDQNILSHPAQNNSGMPEPTEDNSMDQAPAAGSLNPKPSFLQESVPLRGEMGLRGPGTMDQFYRSVVNIPGSALNRAASKLASEYVSFDEVAARHPGMSLGVFQGDGSTYDFVEVRDPETHKVVKNYSVQHDKDNIGKAQKTAANWDEDEFGEKMPDPDLPHLPTPPSTLTPDKKAALDAQEKESLLAILQGICGEIAATFVSAFKVTNRPLVTGVPGEGVVVLHGPGETSMPLSTQYDQGLGARVKTLVRSMNDSDIQEILNESWSQASVWSKGFCYEVLVRAEAFDDETLEVHYKFITQMRESK